MGFSRGFGAAGRAFTLALGAALLSATAAPAWAGEGMPQLDFGNTLTIAQVVWLAIIFVVLYVLLSQWALPQVASVLEHRANAIAADLDTARRAKAQADAAAADQAQATREAHATAQAQIAEAVGAAKAHADRETAAVNARLDAQIAAAERGIAESQAQAMGALEQVASETARDVVARLTGSVIDAGLVNRAVADVMAARAA